MFGHLRRFWLACHACHGSALAMRSLWQLELASRPNSPGHLPDYLYLIPTSLLGRLHEGAQPQPLPARASQDVTDEVSKFGEVLQSHVLPMSDGQMLFQFASEDGASKATASMHGRWFNKKQIVAESIGEDVYHEAVTAN